MSNSYKIVSKPSKNDEVVLENEVKIGVQAVVAVVIFICMFFIKA